MGANVQIFRAAVQSSMYLCAMKEPVNPFFVLSDGQYCQFLEDRLIIGKADVPDPLPKPAAVNDIETLLLQGIGIAILGFFTVMTIVVAYYVVTFTLLALLVLLAVWFKRTLGFTNTRAIMRTDIVGTTYHKRAFGYDFFILSYAGPKGKLLKRRLVIYDSQKCLEQALLVMQEQGVLK
jgi:hypothetical protein